MSRLSVHDLSPRYQEQVMKQIYAGKPDFVVPETPTAKKRLRQSTKPVMNKLEERFYDKLKIDYVANGDIVLCQAVRLELARGIWYKPDFYVPRGNVVGQVYCGPIFYEVKGPKSFRGGFENLKIAARVHSWAKFYLVWEDDNRIWQRQEILP